MVNKGSGIARLLLRFLITTLTLRRNCSDKTYFFILSIVANVGRSVTEGRKEAYQAIVYAIQDSFAILPCNSGGLMEVEWFYFEDKNKLIRVVARDKNGQKIGLKPTKWSRYTDFTGINANIKIRNVKYSRDHGVFYCIFKGGASIVKLNIIVEKRKTTFRRSLVTSTRPPITRQRRSNTSMKPSITSRSPSSKSQRPSSTSTRPSSTSTRPSSTSTRPSNTSTRPSSTSTRPSSTRSRPSSTSSRPSSTSTRPSSTSTRPSSTSTRPSSTSRRSSTEDPAGFVRENPTKDPGSSDDKITTIALSASVGSIIITAVIVVIVFIVLSRRDCLPTICHQKPKNSNQQSLHLSHLPAVAVDHTVTSKGVPVCQITASAPPLEYEQIHPDDDFVGGAVAGVHTP